MTTFSTDQFVAHRGYASRFPENTLRAFEEAVRHGARHIEFDIQLSQDAVPMVYHDVELERVSGRPGRIFDYPAAELVVFSAHEPQRFGRQFADVTICTLAQAVEWMQRHPDVHFYPEIKEESLQEFTTDVCLQQVLAVLAPVLSQCTLISFDLPAMKRARDKYGVTRTGIVLRDWQNRDALVQAHQADIAYINLKRIPPEETIRAVCPLVIYEIAEPELARQTLERGAAKIETHAIGELTGSLCCTNTMSS